MRTRILFIGIVLIALAASVAPTGAQRPYELSTVSITVEPNPTVFSTPVRIEGRVRGDGREVNVLLQSAITRTGTFTTLQRGRTARNGTYRFGHRPSRNLYYRVVLEAQPASASPPVLLRVRMLVGLRISDTTPAAGSRVRFSGIVRPPHNGRRAYIQRRTSAGRWVTVRRTTLRRLDARSSRYAVSLRVRRSATYRARVLGHDDHAMGISRERSVVVR